MKMKREKNVGCGGRNLRTAAAVAAATVEG
jgi:hypothetical protein